MKLLILVFFRNWSVCVWRTSANIKLPRVKKHIFSQVSEKYFCKRDLQKEIFFTIPLKAVHEQVSRPNYVSNRTSQKFKPFTHFTLHKKWSFPFRISSVNVTRSTDTKLLIRVVGLKKKRFLRYVIIKWSYGQDEKVRGAKSATTCKTGILAVWDRPLQKLIVLEIVSDSNETTLGDVVYTSYRRWNDVVCLLGYDVGENILRCSVRGEGFSARQQDLSE